MESGRGKFSYRRIYIKWRQYIEVEAEETKVCWSQCEKPNAEERGKKREQPTFYGNRTQFFVLFIIFLYKLHLHFPTFFQLFCSIKHLCVCLCVCFME